MGVCYQVLPAVPRTPPRHDLRSTFGTAPRGDGPRRQGFRRTHPEGVLAAVPGMPGCVRAPARLQLHDMLLGAVPGEEEFLLPLRRRVVQPRAFHALPLRALSERLQEG